MNVLSRAVVVVALFAAVMTGQPMNTNAADASPLVGSNAAFATDLYTVLKKADGNLFFSPYSISTCLAMTYAGARGDTATQMAHALHFDLNQTQLVASFGELQKQLNDENGKNGNALDLANGLWGQKEHPFLPAFLNVAGQSYGAYLKQTDFRTQAESVRMEINEWISGKTNGKIRDLLPKGVLDPTTKLVLANAIYFKGTWARKFEKSRTEKMLFSITPTQKLETPMMTASADFNYAEADGMQLLELPYAGDDLAMVILLPRETNGLKGVEDLLEAHSLDRWLAQAHKQKVEVSFPKFKLEAEFNLATPLAAMGMTDAFSRRADFSGMDGERDLFISAVVHKAFVEVDEEGTVAAAATGVVMTRMSAMRPLPPPVFRADHPFIFLIRDTHSGSILFLGRLVDPTKS